jgi:predicted nucleic acid-binding protein
VTRGAEAVDPPSHSSPPRALEEATPANVPEAPLIDLLVRSDAGERVRQRLADDADATLITVAHLDAEAFSGLARLHRAKALTATEVDELSSRLTWLEVRRVPISGALLDTAWQMRDNIAARDALYVAAARDLGCALLTTDERLARAVPELAVELAR